MVIKEESQRYLATPAYHCKKFNKYEFDGQRNAQVECACCKKNGHAIYQCCKLTRYLEGYKFYKPPNE
ncbi:hypothetical protein, partial [Plesiomonas shigelloides]|uniref:hypothetical protein n=1 Tax=Plesiomonas shigelloides TaxID=703 RepID=UPI001E4BC909